MSGNLSVATLAYLKISQMTPNETGTTSETIIFDSIDKCPGARGDSPHIATQTAKPKKTAMDARDITSRDFLNIAAALRGRLS
jgi:hypothetical protein